MIQKNDNEAKRKKLWMAEGIFFLSFLIILVGVNLITPDRESSEIENRTLAQRPKPTIQSIQSGKFEERFETYLSDQAAGRDFFKVLQSNVRYGMGNRLFDGIYAGKNDYLLQEFQEPTNEQIQEKVNIVKQFQKQNDKLNMYFLLAPTSVGILEKNLPKGAPKSSQLATIEDFYGKLPKKVNTIDVTSTLKEHSDERIYYRTDHHWTTLGAYYGYEATKKEMNLKTKQEFTSYTVANDFQGTLTAGAGIYQDVYDTVEIMVPKEEEKMIVTYVEEQKRAVSPYDEEKLKEHDKYQVFFGGNHSLIRIETAVDTNRKLLVMKDSYGNSMVPFLTSHFVEIDMVDPRYYYDDLSKLIEERGITDVLFLFNANTFFTDITLKSVLES